ncbi:hypothetical protein C1646_758172 [Rhizophagus diaphanus]|nr:hypothetical protein C1646_758172 [Rhizophagus diaphanus] [Rhizophagus sp. MUCL 43196]
MSSDVKASNTKKLYTQFTKTPAWWLLTTNLSTTSSWKANPRASNKEAVVVKIVSLFKDWNVTIRQKGIVTTSQGGFQVSKDTIVAPDVAFTPKKRIQKLSKNQISTFEAG